MNQRMDTYVQCPYCMGFNTYRAPLFRKLNGDVNTTVPENVKRFLGINWTPKKWMSIADESEHKFLGVCDSCHAKFIVEDDLIVRISSDNEQSEIKKDLFSMTIEDIFSLNISHIAWPHTAIISGSIVSGCIQIGDEIIISSQGNNVKAIVLAIEIFQKLLPCAEVGDNCGLLLNVSKDKIHIGDTLNKNKE